MSERMHDHPRPYCGEGCPAFGDALARYPRTAPKAEAASQPAAPPIDVEQLQQIANQHVIDVFGDGLSDGRWQAIAAEYARQEASHE